VIEQQPAPAIVAAVQTWLREVVIGLNLCPFAADPNWKQQIRFAVSNARAEPELLTDLQAELRFLDQHPPTQLETTLLVIPHILAEFEVYNQFLFWVDTLLRESGWEGEYQVASFHPRYQFADTRPEAVENLTNRSPYPILHILRESSVEAVLAHYPEPERIPARNIQTVQALTTAERRQLFPYLFGGDH